MSRRYVTIRTRLFFAFTFIGLITATLIGIQSYRSAEIIITDTQKSMLSSLLSVRQSQVAERFDSLYSEFQYFAEQNPVVSFAEELTDAYASVGAAAAVKEQCLTQLEKYYQENFMPQFIQIPYLVRSSATYMPYLDQAVLLQCAYMTYKPTAAVLEATDTHRQLYNEAFPTLNSIRKRFRFKDLLIISADGHVVFSTNLQPDFATSLAIGPWRHSGLAGAFSRTETESGTQIFDYSFYMPSGFHATSFVTAPLIRNGEMKGVIVGLLDDNYFDRIVTNNYNWLRDGLRSTGDSYLVGSDLMMRSNSRHAIEDIDSYITDLEKMSYSKEAIEMIRKTASSVLITKDTSPLVRSIFRNESGVDFTTDMIGKGVLMAYAPMRLRGLDWGIVVKMDEFEAGSPIRILQGDILRSVALVMVLILVLTFFVSNAIHWPIKALSNAVKRISEGDYSGRIGDDSSDEMGAFSKAFDQMVDTVNERSRALVQVNESLRAEVEERRQAELALQNEQNFTNRLLDSQVILLMVTSINNTIVSTNKKMQEVTGYTAYELSEKPPEQLFPDNKDDVRAAHRAVLRHGDEHPFFVAEFRNKNGAKKTVRWIVSPFRDSTSLVLWTGVDISDQKEAEARLQDNQNMMESFINAAQDAIIVSDSEGKVVRCNESSIHMFGYQMDEMRKKHMVPDLIPEKYNKEINDIQEEGMAFGSNRIGYTFEVECIHSDESMFPAEISLSLVKMDDEWISLYIVRDITSRYEREAALTSAVEKAQLAEKAKADFLANMSHEIRTPLNGIMGFLELLQQTSLTGVQRDYLKIVNNSTDSLLEIINDILDFSKIESGNLHVELLEFNVYKELEQIAETYLVKINQKELDFVFEIDPLLPTWLVGDPLRVKQILLNLLSNAIKFTPENGQIYFNATMLAEDNDTVTMRLSVKDSGIGMKKEVQENIFQAFQQADASITRSYGGTGLGLAISARLANHMGSKLMLESELGKGSCFWFDVMFDKGSKPSEKDSFEGMHIAVCYSGDYKPAQRNNLLNYLKALKTDVHVFDELPSKKELEGSQVLFVNRHAIEQGIEPADKMKIVLVDAMSDKPKETFNADKVLFRPVYVAKISNAVKELFNNAIFAKEVYIKGTALVAEDQLVNQHLIKLLLTNVGMTVEVVENGQFALSRAMERKFDIIFADIHMPVMDGLSFARKFTAWEKEHGMVHTPLIAVTADVVDNNSITYVEHGIDDFIGKPIVLAKLVELLEKYLK